MELEQFIAKYWGKPGGAERATYQMFLTELAMVLGAPTPDPASGGLLGNYQFEGPVKSEAALGKKGTGRIDLYKRDCFILEAKQSQLKEGEAPPEEPPVEAAEPVRDLFGNITGYQSVGGKLRPRYDRLMAEARIQAERYSLALPSGHKPPPFLIVADVGRTFEVYFDWTGDGRGYGFFPDQQNYRITLEQLRDAQVRELLHAIWLDPASIDPRKKAVEVTRDIAERLSRVAAQLESDERERLKIRDHAEFEVSLGIEKTALFLMRVLFCMFAEDVELLPKGSFVQFLDESRAKSNNWWRAGLHDLWAKMNQRDEANRFWPYGDAIVRYFNGNLFSSATVYDLPQEFRGELYEAAKRDWRSVEPAIFGTLLEQVLTPSERAKLGAHYTPRPYVQRLVSATIGDLLIPEWEGARDRARASEEAGDHAAAIAALKAFHDRLCALRILDPACGTGNFLYVSMELLLQLEGEAIQLAIELGEDMAPSVHPNQFLGLELNPRAAVIAELVLWIGWLRHRLANHPASIADPVLPTLTNINFGTHGGYDAVLRHKPTGEPDIENPVIPDWPEADFIIGNPPFIGGKDIRSSLGGDYAEALWRANPRVPKSADFVMQWWDRAAHELTAPASRLRRFGFVTTNSITQTFSRRVIEGYLAPESPSPSREGSGVGAVPKRGTKTTSPTPTPPLKGRGLNTSLSLILAIPDHPWTKATKDAAAVRIAMTVAERGVHEGQLIEITGEAGLETDNPVLEERAARGRINPDLSLGADSGAVVALQANLGLGYRGVQLIGAGFIVSPSEAEALGLGKRDGLDQFIRPYRNGRDLLQNSRNVMVIDLFGLEEKDVRQRFPEVYQHLFATIRPQREEQVRKSPTSDAKAYAALWWQFGKPRQELRPALSGLPRYIATVETAKHRIFEFLEATITPDNRIVVIADGTAETLGILSSSIHVGWTLAQGGTLEDRPIYTKSQCFDPFPFPDSTPKQRSEIAELAEELDEARKAALTEVPGLTMTEIYNWRDKLRAAAQGGVGLSPQDQDRARAARAGIVDDLHGRIDKAVAAAYGWPADLPPAEVVARLVALNAERAAEEKAGKVRWLRPDYQISRFGAKRDPGSSPG